MSEDKKVLTDEELKDANGGGFGAGLKPGRVEFDLETATVETDLGIASPVQLPFGSEFFEGDTNEDQ